MYLLFFLDRKMSFRKVTLTSLAQRLQWRSVWRQENQKEAEMKLGWEQEIVIKRQ